MSVQWKHFNGLFGFLWLLSRKSKCLPDGPCHFLFWSLTLQTSLYGTGNQNNYFQRSSFPKNVTHPAFPKLQMSHYITADWGFLEATSPFLFQLRQAIYLNSSKQHRVDQRAQIYNIVIMLFLDYAEPLYF